MADAAGSIRDTRSSGRPSTSMATRSRNCAGEYASSSNGTGRSSRCSTFAPVSRSSSTRNGEAICSCLRGGRREGERDLPPGRGERQREQQAVLRGAPGSPPLRLAGGEPERVPLEEAVHLTAVLVREEGAGGFAARQPPVGHPAHAHVREGAAHHLSQVEHAHRARPRAARGEVEVQRRVLEPAVEDAARQPLRAGAGELQPGVQLGYITSSASDAA